MRKTNITILAKDLGIGHRIFKKMITPKNKKAFISSFVVMHILEVDDQIIATNAMGDQMNFNIYDTITIIVGRK
jgi:hypothetical protein